MAVVSYCLIHVLACFIITAGISCCLALYLASLEEVSEILEKQKDSRTSDDQHVMPSPCCHRNPFKICVPTQMQLIVSFIGW